MCRCGPVMNDASLRDRPNRGERPLLFRLFWTPQAIDRSTRYLPRLTRSVS